MAHAIGFTDLVEAQKTNVKEIDTTILKQWMDDHKSFILVDVREDREWDNGHLPQAIHMGKGVIERDINKHIEDKDATIVLYCGGGYRSILAAHNIQLMGYTNVYSLAGGWRDWSSKYEIVQPE